MSCDRMNHSAGGPGRASTARGASRRRARLAALLPLAAALAGAPAQLAAAQGAAATPESSREFDAVVRPFLEAHCTACHGEKKQKGDLRLDTLSRDFLNPAAAGHWMEVMERIDSGDMPPKKEARPAPGDIARVAEQITLQLTEAETHRQAAEGETVSFRRLSRDEYRNTIRDLLGVACDVADPAGLPEDPDWQGFERIGAVLTISPAHIEKYLAAADAALSEALALGPQPASTTVRMRAVDFHRISGEVAKLLEAQGTIDRARIDIVPNNGANGTPGEGNELKIATAGEYRFRVRLSALRPPGGRAPRLLVYAAGIDRTLFEQDVEAPEDQPTTLEFRAHLPAGVHQMRVINAVPGPNPEGRQSRPLNSKPFFSLQARQPWQIKLTDDAFKPIWPTILLDWLEYEGPLQASWPPPAHQAIFAGDAGSGDAAGDAAHAREVLVRFLGRAFRRPARPDEVERLMTLVERERRLGGGFAASLKPALLAALCSTSFLYLVEGSAGAPSPRLGDWELASRLSYFLWSSMPDERLLDLARQGTLRQPGTLRAEARRMLADARARAFMDAFPRQWLQLRRVGMFAPDRKLYPEYDDYLEKSMVGETTAFFREVLQRDLGLREFLDSDWTMLNERLALHYGIAGVDGQEFRRVALKPEDHRGGLLTQAAILSLTSDGTRHRPVHRGKWILESIIGKPPPPPPANVPPIRTSAPGQPKATLRAKLEAHREDPNCAACHRKIDPLGLAFDNYDAIGHWRTTEAVRDGAGADPMLDPSGELPDGRAFADAAGLKRLLAADLDRFALAFCDKLATYALRRGMTFADRAELAAIATGAKAQDYHLASLIEQLVASPLFQKR
jgi:mono/diheme cytochrome c family protein